MTSVNGMPEAAGHDQEPPGGSASRVLVVDPIAPAALEQLRASYQLTLRLQPAEVELTRLVCGMDAIVLRSGISLSAPVIAAGDRLKVIARAGTGTDNIDLGAARKAGIQVFNIPDVSGAAVAEFALGLIFAVTRRIALADRQLRQGLWKKAELAGTELGGKTIGIVGLGRIGSRLADLTRALGMGVVASVGNPDPRRRELATRRGIEMVSTADVLRRADVVALTCSLNHTSHHLIGAVELATMKRSAYLVNVSRGAVVDEDSLYAALAAGQIAGAAVDVFARERQQNRLADLDNVVLTPHIGAMSAESQERIGQLLVEGLRLGLAGLDTPTRIC